MTEIEKKLLKSLTQKETIKSGKISIDLTSSYYIVSSDFVSPNVFTITPLNFVQAGQNIQFSQNIYLFGFTDYQSDYSESRKNFKESFSETQGLLNVDKRKFDENYFFTLADRLVKNIEYDFNFNGLTKIQIPVQSFSTFSKGDLIMIRYTESAILGVGNTKNFYIIETLIHSNELPYLNLCEMLNDSQLKIKSLTYDFTNRHSTIFSTQSIPKQNELPISFMRSTIFGQPKTDSINPMAFAPASNYNSTNIFIPLKTNGKNLTINIPLAFDIISHKLTFQLSY
jgi:hypothetical protein